VLLDVGCNAHMTPVVLLVLWFNLQVQQAEVMLGQGQHVLAVAVLSGGYEQLGCEGVPLEEVGASCLAALTDCKKRVGRGTHMLMTGAHTMLNPTPTLLQG
jgi:hypothetical protein